MVGLTQPFAGAAADRFGAGLAGPAVLMAAVTRVSAPQQRGMATGIVNAGGSFGQFVMAPVAGALSLALGWSHAMQVLEVGGFLGAWLGGRVFQSTGSFEAMWWVDIALALGAALVHLPIREVRLAPATQAQPA